MSSEYQAVRKMMWGNIAFFIFSTVAGVFGGAWYIAHHGFDLADGLLFFFMTAATGFSITLGYHRLFSHSAFQAHPIVKFLVLFFGAAAFEQPCLKWSSQHRIHHKYVDTPMDPYNIKQGFFHAHIGWLMFWDYDFNYDNVKDLQKDPMIMHQHNHYGLWAVGAGVVFPLVIGALTGHLLGSFLLGFALRAFVVHHTTFFINSICHTVGKRDFDPLSSAADSPWVALLTFGEGYHNYHHCFPSDYRNGVAWYAWDPTKWIIYFLSKLGLASNLKRVSRPVQYRTEIKARYQDMQERFKLAGQSFSTKYAGLVNQFHDQYESMRQQLESWESQLKQHSTKVSQDIGQYSSDSRKELLAKVQEARERFQILYTEWMRLAQTLQTAVA